jgi:hypothetical protein
VNFVSKSPHGNGPLPVPGEHFWKCLENVDQVLGREQLARGLECSILQADAPLDDAANSQSARSLQGRVTDVFISYKREERPLVEQIAYALGILVRRVVRRRLDGWRELL